MWDPENGASSLFVCLLPICIRVKQPWWVIIGISCFPSWVSSTDVKKRARYLYIYATWIFLFDNPPPSLFQTGLFPPFPTSEAVCEFPNDRAVRLENIFFVHVDSTYHTIIYIPGPTHMSRSFGGLNFLAWVHGTATFFLSVWVSDSEPRFPICIALRWAWVKWNTIARKGVNYVGPWFLKWVFLGGIQTCSLSGFLHGRICKLVCLYIII